MTGAAARPGRPGHAPPCLAPPRARAGAWAGLGRAVSIAEGVGGAGAKGGAGPAAVNLSTSSTLKTSLLPPSPPLSSPQYEDGTAPALALQATIDRTEKRFANYGKAGLLCGTDGLPHLIADPGLALRYGHAGETLIPTVGFLYIAGWIGYVGREYLGIVAKGAKPTEKEIIIDVPLALSLAWKGAGWPARAVAELRNGTLLEDDDNITVSPR
jgi:hypothetical protein